MVDMSPTALGGVRVKISCGRARMPLFMQLSFELELSSRTRRGEPFKSSLSSRACEGAGMKFRFDPPRSWDLYRGFLGRGA